MTAHCTRCQQDLSSIGGAATHLRVCDGPLHDPTFGPVVDGFEAEIADEVAMERQAERESRRLGGPHGRA